VGIANEVHTNNIIIVGIAMGGGHGDLCLMIWVLPTKICKKNTPSSISLRDQGWDDFTNL